jgi:hypothetical protein
MRRCKLVCPVSVRMKCGTHQAHKNLMQHDCMLLLCSIQALLSAPNPDDPLAENVAKHWKENEPEAMAVGRCLAGCRTQKACCGLR